MTFKELYQPVHTIIGEGCIHEIPRHIGNFGGKKALVVTDAGVLKEETGVVALPTLAVEKGELTWTGERIWTESR